MPSARPLVADPWDMPNVRLQWAQVGGKISIKEREIFIYNKKSTKTKEIKNVKCKI